MIMGLDCGTTVCQLMAVSQDSHILNVDGAGSKFSEFATHFLKSKSQHTPFPVTVHWMYLTIIEIHFSLICWFEFINVGCVIGF